MAQITTSRIHEIRVNGKPLGRHVHHDSRSRNHPAELAAGITTVTHEAVGLPLDQGQIGSCTANALVGALNCAPNYGTHPDSPGAPWTETDAVRLYERETADEGQPYPPYDPGGSGLAVCRAAKELGMVKGYTHTFSAQAALHALVLRPVIVGINWYSSFDQPDGNGVISIEPSAFVRGGHEILANGIDADNKLVWFWNSWGTGYGLSGRMAMSWDTLARLLGEQGDVTVPVVA
jgi:hypothetical protein